MDAAMKEEKRILTYAVKQSGKYTVKKAKNIMNALSTRHTDGFRG